MAGGRFFEGLLYWTMAVVGGATLAPCVVLPALFEYEAQLAVNATAEQRNRELQERLTAVERQIAYVERDPSYLERLAGLEFGIVPPGVTPIIVENGAAEDAAAPAGTTRLAGETHVPELSHFVRKLLDKHPLAKIFVLPEARPIAMACGTILLVTAIVLLGAPQRRARRAARQA